jgi:hypothetical protein
LFAAGESSRFKLRATSSFLQPATPLSPDTGRATEPWGTPSTRRPGPARTMRCIVLLPVTVPRVDFPFFEGLICKIADVRKS